MSDSKIIIIDEYKVQDFISIEHGTEKITLSIFVRNLGQHLAIAIKTEHARELASELIRRANIIEGVQP